MLKPILRAVAGATVAATLAATLAACAPTSAPRPAGAYTVQVVNEGIVPLYDVRVTTGEEGSTITRIALGAGERTAFVPVRVVHADPLVTVIANGREIVLHPIEGFTGFNPARQPGAYVVRLRFVPPEALNVRVTEEP